MAFAFLLLWDKVNGHIFEGRGHGGVTPKVILLQVSSSLICAHLNGYGTSLILSLKHVIPLLASPARLTLTHWLGSPFLLI